jgi:hypothetical protein
MQKVHNLGRNLTAAKPQGKQGQVSSSEKTISARAMPPFGSTCKEGWIRLAGGLVGMSEQKWGQCQWRGLFIFCRPYAVF